MADIKKYIIPNKSGLSTTIVPNNSAILKQNLTKSDEANGNVDYDADGNISGESLTRFVIDDTQELKYVFENVSFAEIGNLYENFVMNAFWDTRENGDFQTVLLIRRHMFYKTMNADYVINTSGTLLKEIFIEGNTSPLSPMKFFIDFQNKLKQVDPDIKNEPDIPSITKSDKVESNVDFREGLSNLVHRNQCRKYSENHFAISRINLISHKIEINEEVINAISFPTTLGKNNAKLIVTILNDPQKEKYHMSPATHGPNSLGQELTDKNMMLQIESSASQLIKSLETVYSGRIFMLYNKDIQTNDTITLLDETSSTYGIFKVESFEHVLDNRGLITIVDVVALFDIKDPTLDHFSQSIGYKLSAEFAKTYNITDESLETIKEEDEVTEHSILARLYGLYLKTVTQSIKYASIILRYDAAEQLQMSGASFNNMIAPTPIPLRFIPMTRKGKAEIPTCLESAFFNHYEYGNHKSLVSRYLNNFSRKISRYAHSIRVGIGPLLNTIGDFLISVVTLNLHELFKGVLGFNNKKARNAIVGGNAYVGPKEFEKARTRYNPFTNAPLGRTYQQTFAFFNVRLQSLSDLYDGDVSKNHTFVKEDVTKRISKKEEITRTYITNLFDYTFLVELYDGFNGKEEGQKNIDGLNYSYEDFIKAIVPDNGNFYLNTGKLMSNEHGSEYGAVVGKQKGSFELVGLGGDPQNQNVNERNRKYHKALIDVEPNTELYKSGIKKIMFFWFHALYGVSKQGQTDIQSQRKHFIQKVLFDMEDYVKSHKEHGVALMADCNMEIVNKGQQPIYSPASSAQNLTFVLSSNYLISKIHKKTSLTKNNQVNNVFDNIVISKNMEDYVVCSSYNYPYANKRDVSDHIPVYIGVK
ncbi:hypothetical protein C4N15_07535 [Fusobacterium necrophorum subsp. funduliforme]|uniref:hypothetical protein n=1 Tax=Fusobacterium necrophorum TaxID=859 RepID=UPI000D1210E5|nr:hypothetical protein [Fusobacterium necrophorum]AVQ21509.1 hypothetical protein C4N15_07535 [Fusobacterium necrophorum subsp. funduliforme]